MAAQTIADKEDKKINATVIMTHNKGFANHLCPFPHHDFICIKITRMVLAHELVKQYSCVFAN